jgi:hypothetical protein
MENEPSILKSLRKELIKMVFEYINKKDSFILRKTHNKKVVSCISEMKFKNCFDSDPSHLKDLKQIRIQHHLESFVIVDNTTIIEKEFNQNYLIYPNKFNELELLDLNNFRVRRKLECCSNGKILHIKHYQGIRKLIICSNNFIQVWNTDSFESELVIHDKELCLSCISIGLSKGTEYIFAGLLSGEHILVYHKEKLYKKIDLNQECSLILSDLLFKNDLFIITAGSKALFINNFETGKIIKKYNLDKGLVKCLITSEENPSIIVIGTTDGFVQIFSIHSEKMLKTLYIGWMGSGIRWNREYVVFSCLGRLSIINIKLGLEVRDLVLPENGENSIRTLAKLLHPEYNECLMCVCKEKIMIWKN